MQGEDAYEAEQEAAALGEPTIALPPGENRVP